MSKNATDLGLSERRAKVFAALSDPTRLRLVEILAQGEELCGSAIAEKAGISMALLSHHWKVLTEAGLINRRRVGQRQYCSLNRQTLETTFQSLAVAEDQGAAGREDAGGCDCDEEDEG